MKDAHHLGTSLIDLGAGYLGGNNPRQGEKSRNKNQQQGEKADVTTTPFFPRDPVTLWSTTKEANDAPVIQ